MKDDLPVKDGIIIPGYELDIETSRSGGAGGQHVNKTDTRVSVRWNVNTTSALDESQKKLILQKLQSRLTSDGDLIIHCGASRSQQQNKEMARARLAEELCKALYIPKKRMRTSMSKSAKAARLQNKVHRSKIKKIRSQKLFDD